MEDFHRGWGVTPEPRGKNKESGLPTATWLTSVLLPEAPLRGGTRSVMVAGFSLFLKVPGRRSVNMSGEFVSVYVCKSTSACACRG